jgi:mono/diheme cytochrome c family protein
VRTSSRITLTFVTAISMALSIVAARAQAPAGAAAGNPTNGKKLYEAYTCYGCHGFNGETGVRALVASRSANLASESNFIAFLRARANVAPTQPSTSMPNYSAATLPDAQAKDIYAYIKTFKTHAPPVDQIPVFGQILTEAGKPYKP